MTEIKYTINGVERTGTIEDSLLLIDLIRDTLKLKGTKQGCLEGECGACTVLVNGKAVNSCLFPAVNVNDKEILTIEGVSGKNDELHPVQKALIDYGAVQCGFCTSGMVMSIISYYESCMTKKHTPDREEIKYAISGNLCRCTGYVKILDAIESLFGNTE